MSHTHQPHRSSQRSSQRDAGLRRLRQLNRTLAAATVALTLLFVNAAARAFPGHARTAKVASPSAPSTRGATTRRSAARPARGHPPAHRTRFHRAAASPSATTTHRAPQTGTATTDTDTSQALSPPPSPPQSAPAPASAPVVSGGS